MATFSCLIDIEVVVEGELVRVEFFHHVSYVVEQSLPLVVSRPSISQLCTRNVKLLKMCHVTSTLLRDSSRNP